MGLFEHALEELAEWRHRDIFRRLPRRSRPSHDPLDGFMSYAEAASIMGVSVSETIKMGLYGALEIDLERMLIRPAIVSTLGVELVS